MIVKSELLRFKTEDDLDLQGLFNHSTSKKCLIHIHGWAGNMCENSFVDAFAKLYNKLGIGFFTFNNRGMGIINEFRKANKAEKIGGSLEKFEECIFDIDAAIKLIKEKGYDDIILQGHSLGCQKAVYYQYKRRNPLVKSMILLAPVDDVPFATSLLGKEKMVEALDIAHKMKQSGKGQDPVPDWMQFYPLLSANMFIQVSDPKSESGRIFDFSGDLKEAKSLNIPIFAVFGSKDDYQIDPKRALEILDKIENIQTALIVDGNHWFTGKEKELIDEISKWLVQI